MLFRNSWLRWAGCGCLSLLRLQQPVACGCSARCGPSPSPGSCVGGGGAALAGLHRESASLPNTRVQHMSAMYLICCVFSAGSGVCVVIHLRLSGGLSDAVSLRPGTGVLGAAWRGAGQEVPSPPLSDGARLVFLTVIAASVWVKLNWEVVTGGEEKQDKCIIL